MGLQKWFYIGLLGMIVLDPWDLIKLGWILLMILAGAIFDNLDVFG